MDKAKFRSMFKCVLVLAVIALCSGLLLGAFNILTYVDPLQSTYERFAADTGATFSKMTDEEGKAYENGNVVYYAVSDDGVYHAFLAEGKGGYLGVVQLYVYISENNITKVVLGENSETLWATFEDDFFEQFNGLEMNQISSFLPSDITTSSTAKKTIQAVSGAIDSVVKYYNEIVGGENNG